MMLAGVVERWSVHALIKSHCEIEPTSIGSLQFGIADAIYAVDVMSGGKCLLYSRDASGDAVRPFTTLEIELDCDGDELMFMGLIALTVFAKGRHDFDPESEPRPFGMDSKSFDEFFTHAMACWELHVVASNALSRFVLPSLRLNRKAGTQVWVCGQLWFSRADIENQTDCFVYLDNAKAILKDRGAATYEVEVLEGPLSGVIGFVDESAVREFPSRSPRQWSVGEEISVVGRMYWTAYDLRDGTERFDEIPVGTRAGILQTENGNYEVRLHDGPLVGRRGWLRGNALRSVVT